MYIRKSRAGINHLKESTVRIGPSLKICRSVAPQSIENRFIGSLVLLWLLIDWESIQMLSGCHSDLLIDWESIQMLSGCHSDCWSIENRFKCSLVATLICWSIENRFKCSLVATLICWSIENRFKCSLVALICWSIENRFKCSLVATLIADRLGIDSVHLWFIIRILNRLAIDSWFFTKLLSVIKSSSVVQTR